MSMNPDGSNRIIQQQVKEWHAQLEMERSARLLGSASPKLRWSFGAWTRQAASAIGRPGLLIREWRSQKPGD